MSTRPLPRYTGLQGNPKITASFATFAPRAESAARVAADLLPQVDELRVYFNDWMDLPDWTEHPKVVAATGLDLSDAGKYFDPPQEGVHLVCDDDLYYPPTYVKQTLRGIDKYGCVAWGGKRFDKTPVPSFYRGASLKLRVFEDVRTPLVIHMPLTCVFAYDTRLVTFSSTDFPLSMPHMADIHTGVVLNRKGVDCVCLPHKGSWIKHQEIDHSTTIWQRFHRDDAKQTQLVNSVKWS